jgi:phosphoenolpyruvate carboxylase
MNSDDILDEYVMLHKKKFKFTPLYLRPYLARSDPALNAGIVATVLAIKVALSKYKIFSKKTGIILYPIIGSASLPFRGGLTPHSVEAFANEYKGVRTALIQSAFRYDYDKKDVITGITQLEKLLPQNQAMDISMKDEEKLRELVAIFEGFYQPTVEGIADDINTVATSLPRRRERVQHVGLFGYSRGVGKVKLPRAIGFTAALYSIGVPPELIGTGRGLRKAESLGYREIIEKYYINLKSDLIRAGRYLNKENLKRLVNKDSIWKDVLVDVSEIEKYLGQLLLPKTKEEKKHQKITTQIAKRLDSGESIAKLIEEAAVLRKSLG